MKSSGRRRALFAAGMGLLAYACDRHTDRWVKVTEYRALTLYVDPSSAKKSGPSTREVWFKTEYRTPQILVGVSGKPPAYTRERLLYRFDCADHSTALLEQIFYAADGSFIKSLDFTDPKFDRRHSLRLRAAVPETTGEQVLIAGCLVRLTS